MKSFLRALLLFPLGAYSAWAVLPLTVVGGGLYVGDAPETLDETTTPAPDDRYPDHILNNVLYGFKEYEGCISTPAGLSVDILVWNNAAVDGVIFGPSSFDWLPTDTTVSGVQPGNGYSSAVASGTSIRCTTVHFQSPNLQDPNLPDIIQWGTGQPAKTILGIVYKPGTLDAWDATCSNGGDIFASGPRHATQGGLDLDGGTVDGLQIDRANNRVTMQASTPAEYDTIRVITSCN